MSRAERRRLKRCRHRKANTKPSGDVSLEPRPPCRWSPTAAGRSLIANLHGTVLFFAYWVADWGRQRKRRPREYWFALFALIFTTIGVFGTWYGALRSAPSEAKVHFDTGIVGEHGGVKSFATSKVHESLTISLKLTPEHQDLGQVVVSIVPPASVRLTDGCSYKITGMRGRRSCLKPSGQGRVEVDRLSAGSTLEVTAKAEVVHSIQDQEAIVLEMRSADTTDSNLKRIDLFSAKGTPGEEAVKEFLADELRGPLHWEESTLQVPDEVFAMLGKQWKALDPTRLHDIEEVPKGKTVDVPSLVNNRLFGAKIVSFQSVMASPPIRVRSFPATPGGPHVFEEVFALESNARGRDLWCSATRGPDQPHLRPGDRVLVRAALVGWGLARPFGRPVAAAMLLCPVVHLLNR